AAIGRNASLRWWADVPTPAAGSRRHPMDRQRVEFWSRRGFLRTCAVAGTMGFLGSAPVPVAAAPPPETTRLRLRRSSVVCLAPQFVAEELFRAEGFTDIQYQRGKEVGSTAKGLASGRIDISMTVFLQQLPRLDAGDPVVMLAGVHGGCYE